MQYSVATDTSITVADSMDPTVPARAWQKPRILMEITCVTGSAALLAVAVPPSSWGALAWIALVPLLFAILHNSPLRAGLLGLVFGVASLAGMHSWLWQLPVFNAYDAVTLLGYLAIYPALWCVAIAWLSGRGLPWVLPGAVLWVLLDWLRSHAGPLALPWEPLAHSQVADVPMLQLAALGGAQAITFAVCLVNLAIAKAWQKRSRPWLLLTAGAVTAVHLYGYLSIPSEFPHNGPRIAIIQPADKGVTQKAKFEELSSLTGQAMHGQPDLIVWPESAVNGYAFNQRLQANLKDLSQALGVPILFGSADFGKYARAAGAAAEDVQFKNQAFMVSPDGTRQGPYTKNRLVPFGEFMPFENVIAWPRWLIQHQRHGISGDAPGLFQLGDTTKFGVVICWENYFPDLAERLVSQGASMIVQLSNDADFGTSTEPAQHNAASILRAVEYGRPWVQVSENGPSMLIDAYGRIVESLGPIGSSEWAVHAVSLAAKNTAYERFGLLWLWLISAIVLGWIIHAICPGKDSKREHAQFG